MSFYTVAIAMKNLVSKHPMFTGSAQDPYTVGQVSFVRALELGGLGIMNLSICMRTSQIARSTSLFASSVIASMPEDSTTHACLITCLIG